MTSYAELLETCSQFQSNFALLNGKYTSLQAELESEKRRSAELCKELQTAKHREAVEEEKNMRLQREVRELQEVRHAHETVLIDLQMANSKTERLERNLQDVEVQHKHEIEQLENQITQWADRVEHMTDSKHIEELQGQIVSLQEQSTLLQRELQNLQERSEMQLQSVNNVLKEQQEVNTELNQRNRQMHSEIKELRDALIKSSELQQNAASLKDKYALEAEEAQRQVETLEQALCSAYCEKQTNNNAHEREVERLAAAHEHTQRVNTNTISKLTRENSELRSQADAAKEQYIDLQRNVSNKIAAAKAESQVEIVSLQTALRTSRDEISKLNLERETCSLRLESEKAATKAALDRVHRVQTELNAKTEKIEVMMEENRWARVEHERVEMEQERTQEHVRRLEAEIQRLQKVAVEVERLKRMLVCSDEQKAELRHLLEGKNAKMEKVTLILEKQLQKSEKEIKRYKELLQAQTAKADALREQLVETLLIQEATLYNAPNEYNDRNNQHISPLLLREQRWGPNKRIIVKPKPFHENKNGKYIPRAEAKDIHSRIYDNMQMPDIAHLPSRNTHSFQTSCDVVDMLKSQAVQAEHLQHSLQLLTGSTTISTSINNNNNNNNNDKRADEELLAEAAGITSNE